MDAKGTGYRLELRDRDGHLMGAPLPVPWDASEPSPPSIADAVFAVVRRAYETAHPTGGET